MELTGLLTSAEPCERNIDIVSFPSRTKSPTFCGAFTEALEPKGFQGPSEPTRIRSSMCTSVSRKTSARFIINFSSLNVLQEVSNASQKKFRISEQADVVEFLQWFLNKLHIDLGGTKKRDSSKWILLYSRVHYPGPHAVLLV